MTTSLRPFVPRFVLEWADECPETRYRSVTGTLVFTDLSGFTAMSERLSRLGKLGAEELTVHLDETFSELLEVAFARGGSLLKFGGDALLIFFWGDDHARRGVAAAHEMRVRLRQVGLRETEAGRFRLRMSVGIHSGDFDFFLVGKSHRELVITGPAATTTVEMESAADAGEILMSNATASLLTPGCSGGRKGGGVLLRRKPRVGAALGRRSIPDIDPEPFVPVALRARLSDPHRDAEHRLVTVAFIHFTGVDSLLANEGPEETGRRIEDLITCVQEEFDREEITFLTTDIYDDGSKIFAQAGAPVSHENDEERMLRTLRKIADQDFGLGLRMGVNRGYIFAGEIGGDQGRTYTAMGDAVNTAARVMSKAEVGQLLATRPVLDRSRTLFETIELPPFAAKGKSQPLVAQSVGRVSGVRATDARGPFVGREEELAVLEEALEQARNGNAAIVEISGEAGSGKSRLLSEFLQRSASDLPKLVVAGNQYESATPYAALGSLVAQALELPLDDRSSWPALLRKRVDDVRPELLEWLPLLGLALDVPLEPTTAVDELAPEFAAQRLASVVGDVLVAAVPYLAAIVIEDAHWIDHASASVIDGVLHRQDVPSWLLAIATRPGDSRVRLPETAATVEVGPLSRERSIDLVKRLAPGRFLPHEVESLVARSGGNPLFLAELVQFDGNGLPDRVEDVFAARIDRLDPDDARLLRSVAVLGEKGDRRLLALALGDESLASPARWRELEDFVELTEEAALFRHALIRDSAYAGLSFRKRRELHRRVGNALEKTPIESTRDPETLSLHFYEAGEWERALTYSREAADRARHRFAVEEAVVFYDRALEASRKTASASRDVRAGIARDLAVVLMYQGRNRAATRIASRGRKWAESPVLGAELAFEEAQGLKKLGDFDRSLRRYRAAVQLAGTSADERGQRARTRARVGIASVRHLQGKFEDAIAVALEVTKEARLAEDRAGLAHAYASLFAAYTAMGNHAAADEFSALPNEVFEEERALWQLASYQTAVGISWYERGEWSQALEWYRRAATAAERSGDADRLAVVENNRGEILSDQGRLSEASKALATAIEIWSASGHQLLLVALANHGRLLVRMGSVKDGLKLLEKSCADMYRIGARHHAMYSDAWIAEGLAVCGDYAGALSRVDRMQSVPTLPAVVQSQLLRTAAIAHAKAQRPDKAARAITSAVAIAEAAHALFDEALALDAWIQLEPSAGSPPKGARRRAQAVFTKLGVVATPAVHHRGDQQMGLTTSESAPSPT